MAELSPGTWPELAEVLTVVRNKVASPFHSLIGSRVAVPRQLHSPSQSTRLHHPTGKLK